MKTPFSLLIAISICLSFSIVSFAEAEPAANEQLIEHSVRIEQLEKEMNNQKEDLNEKLEGKIDDLEKRMEVQNSNIEYKKSEIDTWLTTVGIVLTFFGFAVPLGAWLFSRNLKQEIEKQKADAKQQIDTLVTSSQERVNLLEREAELCIRSLKDKDQKGQQYIEGLEESFKKSKEPHLSELEKNQLQSTNKEIQNNQDATLVEKDIAEALELFFSDNYEESIFKFKETLLKHGKSLNGNRLKDIYFNLGYAYSQLKQYELSIEYFKRHLDIDESDAAITLFNIAHSLFNLDNYPEAIEYYKKSLEKDPKNLDILLNLGIAYSMNGDSEQALQCFNLVMESDPSKGTYMIALEYASSGKLEESLKWSLKAVELDPSAEAWNLLARCYGSLQEYEKAIECYEKEIEASDEEEIKYSNLIEIYILNNELEKAKRILPNLSKERPFIKAFFEVMLNCINKSSSSVEESLTILKKSVEHNPEGIRWSFVEIKMWLSSEKSSHLTLEQKQFITDLIQQLENWIEEGKQKHS